MALCRLVIFVFQLAAFATSAATPSISLPANIEIDVVFPRQGETYDAVSPFPVVFAIQNAAVAWSFGFAFEWHIDTEEGLPADVGNLDVSPDSALNPLVPPADPYLLINKSIELPLHPNDVLTLVWQFTFYGNCTEDADGLAYTFQGVPFNAQGRFNFSTGYGGKAVDVLAGGMCPALGSIVPVQSRIANNCPHIADLGIQPSPCAFTIDAAVASSVSAVVVPTTTAEPTAEASGGGSDGDGGTGTGTGSVPTQTKATTTSSTQISSSAASGGGDGGGGGGVGGTGTGSRSIPTQSKVTTSSTQISSSAGPTAATGSSTTMSSSAGSTSAGSGSTSKNAGVRNAAGQGLTAVMAGVVAVGAVVL